MRKIRFACMAAILVNLLMVYGAFAQTSQLTLRISRDWGYGGLNGDIEGLFSMQASGPADLRRVDFFIDNSQIGEVVQAPFNLQFNLGQSASMALAAAEFVPSATGPLPCPCSALT